MNLEKQAESAINNFLAIKSAMTMINNQVFAEPELAEEIKGLLESEANLKMLVASLPSTNPVNISVVAEPLDYFKEGDSTHTQLRRQRAKELARRIYPKVHPDLAEQKQFFTVQQIKNFVEAGEVEILVIISNQIGIDDVKLDDRIIQNVVMRNSMMSTTPAFKLSRLFFANKAVFLSEARKILVKKKALIDAKQMELMGVVADVKGVTSEDGFKFQPDAGAVMTDKNSLEG